MSTKYKPDEDDHRSCELIAEAGFPLSNLRLPWDVFLLANRISDDPALKEDNFYPDYHERQMRRLEEMSEADREALRARVTAGQTGKAS